MNNKELISQKLELKSEIIGKLKRHFGTTLEDATKLQIYKACALTVRDQIMDKWITSKRYIKRNSKKQLFYLSFEFLMGRALGNNIMNLLKTEVYESLFDDLGIGFEEIEDLEPEPGLGNGGLGRLAACFLDSLATLNLPAYGCGIRYEYGLFRQKILDGYQIEMPDIWLEDGNVWEVPRPEDQVEVHFGGNVSSYDDNGWLRYKQENYFTVIGLPYDMPIYGYDSKVVNTLRLWCSHSPKHIDMPAFSVGDYVKATEEQSLAEVLSKVLYPEDNHYEGKLLRLKQEYFFVSATVQWIIKRIKKQNIPLNRMHQYIQIHINDTHPAVAIPELMRILIDCEGMGWDEAWQVVTNVFAYTNHTVMSEALEKWHINMFADLLPRVYMIVEEMNRRFRIELKEYFGDDHGKINSMEIISNDYINMANLCVMSCHTVNGVSKLHTEILKKDIFKDFYYIQPYKFQNITNGITHRRWLYKANPKLSSLITDFIGDGWVKNPIELNELEKYSDDNVFKKQFAQIKHNNKIELGKYILRTSGIQVDPYSIFDIQIKRLHEYKRQLLNILHIMYLYNAIRQNPNMDMHPRTFIFGAKASPGYKRAKLIIKLINSIADRINNDPLTRELIKVVFIENYNVSLAEKIVTAADVSEQISTAGKEASGTGNMKLMINGALTIGTLDGANVEISELVGDDNIFIFGLRSHEVANVHQLGNYQSPKIYASNYEIKTVVDQLIDGTYEPNKPNLFGEIYHSLVFGDNGFPDPYMVIIDLESYIRAQNDVLLSYKNSEEWWKKAIINVAKAGIFSSDRTIEEYNQKIWRLKPIY